MKEKRVEQVFREEVKRLGGWAIKLLPSVSGLPDRMALLPGEVVFVELKAPNGRVKVHQRVVHRRLGELGFPVEVLSTTDEVREWAKRVDARRSGNE